MTGTPRLAPLPHDRLDPSVRPLVEGGGVNLFATMGRHPALARRFSRFGGHFLAKGALPARDRELVILRTAWNLRTAYEWGHHARIGAGAGLTAEEIARVPAGPAAPGWGAFDQTLLRAADQLLAERRLDDATWAALAERYGEEQLVELPLLVGEYVMVGTFLLTMRVEPEPGLEPLPEG